MAGMFRRAMVYLGLVEDDYDDMYDAGYEDPATGQGQYPQGQYPQGQYPQQAQQGWPQAYGRQVPPAEGDPPQSGVRPVQTGYRPDQSGRGAGELGGIGTITPRPTVVRSVTPLTSVRPHIVVAQDFNSTAQDIGRRFREAQAVIANLQGADRPLRRRLVDFCSGLSYGAGKMDRVAEGVFLLTPANVEVSEDEKRRLEERGFRG